MKPMDLVLQLPQPKNRFFFFGQVHGDVKQETAVAVCEAVLLLALAMLAPCKISHPDIHGLEEGLPLGNLDIKPKPDPPRIPQRNQNLFGFTPGFNSSHIRS